MSITLNALVSNFPSLFSVFDGDFKAETVKIDGVASPYSSYILGKKLLKQLMPFQKSVVKDLSV